MRIISNAELDVVAGGEWYDNWEDFKEALGLGSGPSPSSPTPTPAPEPTLFVGQTVVITGVRPTVTQTEIEVITQPHIVT